MAALRDRPRPSDAPSEPTVGDWIDAVRSLNPGLLGTYAPDLKADAQSLGDGAKSELPVHTLVQQAANVATGRGAARVFERDLLRVLLERLGRTLAEPNEQAGNTTEASQHTGSKTTSTQTLQRFGRNLTAAARAGELVPITGRDDELLAVIETLCRRTKRNPVLVGPAGVGKTAIVEALAQRVASGNVPGPLRDCEIWAVQPSALTAGAHMAGEVEKRVGALLDEARRPGVILFIDEVHSLVGAGGNRGTNDLASLLKPVLARGEISCIAATTDDEYRRFIEADSALERRFQPVRVNELDRVQTLEALRAHAADLRKLRGVEIDDGVLEWIVGFADNSMRNRAFPDKAIDLLEQVVASTVAEGAARVDVAHAGEVARRMVGWSGSLAERLDRLASVLSGSGFAESDVETLCDHLRVTAAGLDVHRERPNAVVLLSGTAAAHASRLAPEVAGALFGDPRRVVSIDLGTFASPADVTRLLGAGPSYVGYGDSVPLDALAQTPWCVLLFESVDAAHPYFRELLEQAIETGAFTRADGNRLYLSDAVVVLTTSDETSSVRRGVGFGVALEEDIGDDELAAKALGAGLARSVTLAVSDLSLAAIARSQFERLLTNLELRVADLGGALTWDTQVTDWLVTKVGHTRGVEHDEVFEDEIASLVATAIAQNPASKVTLTPTADGSRIELETS